ncbi:MAG: M23 family metallopeptidase [Oscillospiraceae bacterium]|nr:M23 family metallopeptidase [Oscillospiraceae bacterium]
MKRGRREHRRTGRGGNFKYLLYLSSGVLAVVIITFIVTFISYNNRLRDTTDNLLALERITGTISNDFNEIGLRTEEASFDLGRSISEALNSMENSLNEENINTHTDVAEVGIPVSAVPEPEPEIVLEFIRPVEGEVVRHFAMDHLIFSPTLQEWITHPGVDVRAPRTTVVVAAEAGIVSAIKNDPRYGLTIIIEHANGYRTVYSNLLTTEFVSEGEKVTRGQSLGTVGNSAAFEILDEPQLHFEILRDGVHVDPKLYINFN